MRHENRKKKNRMHTANAHWADRQEACRSESMPLQSVPKPPHPKCIPRVHWHQVSRSQADRYGASQAGLHTSSLACTRFTCCAKSLQAEARASSCSRIGRASELCMSALDGDRADRVGWRAAVGAAACGAAGTAPAAAPGAGVPCAGACPRRMTGSSARLPPARM